MIFDTHAHYDDEAFDGDRDELLKNMKSNGIGGIVNVGASMDSSRRSLELAKEYPGVFAAVGVHPNETGNLTEEFLDWMVQASEEKLVVAVGEIGLDYYWDEPERKTQKYWFERQLALAARVKLPVIIHSRDAAKDTLEILEADKNRNTGGVIHCFSYSKEMAGKYLDLGYFLGIGGVITFQNAKKVKETVEYCPLDRIVLETDCPYLAPVPNRGKRNSSLNIPYIVEEISKIKNIPIEEVIAITEKNAKNLYPKVNAG